MLRLMSMRAGIGAACLLALTIATSGCGGSGAEGENSNALAACDRATVERWLVDSDLDAWAIGEGASGLEVDLPDTQPDLSARMLQELLDRCDGEVTADIGPPTTPAN